MPQYFVILGREPELALAELAVAAAGEGLALSVERVSHEVALVRGEVPLEFVGKLAGTVKLAQVLGSIPQPTQAKVEEFLLQHLHGKSFEFGFSWYGRTPPPWLEASGLELKNSLRGRGHVRFVTSRQPALTSVVVAKNRLLPPEGYDVVFYPQPNLLTVGRTVWVQNFAAWGERDYGRPSREARVGMLPPKLARLMVNLAGARDGRRLLDPFCGSGTVLQEAALVGCRSLAGADIDARGIERTRQNFAWFKQHAALTVEPKLYVADVRQLGSQLKGQTFNCIVTEPYLGPPLTGRERPTHLKHLQVELATFYREALVALAALLAAGGRMVMVWPVLRAGGEALLLPLERTLAQLGLRLVDVLPPIAPKEWRRERPTLLYHRPDARLAREIAVLERT